MKTRTALFVTIALLLAVMALPVSAGNGAPSGPHYNLNLIGVKDKAASMDGNNGHRIFVRLKGRTKIMLCESGVGSECADVEGFEVLDANGTDGEAAFALPNPDPENDGVTEYSVWARALGRPGGHADMNTCAWSEDLQEDICSISILALDAHGNGNKFQDVSKYLLYIYADLDGDTVPERYPLFDDALEGYFWNYDNDGLKLVQLRFYPISSEDVPVP